MRKLKILATALLSLVVVSASALTLDSTKVYRKALRQIAKCENRPVRYYLVADTVFKVIMNDHFGALADYPKQQAVLEYINKEDVAYITPHLSPALLPLSKHKAEKLKKARIAMCYDPHKWRLVFFSEIKDGMVWANVFYIGFSRFRWCTSLDFNRMLLFNETISYGFIVSDGGEVKQMVWEEYWIE